MDGLNTAHGVIDGIRAVQPSYAPELKFAGVAAGGVPADIEYVARRIDGGVFAGIYIGAAVGLSRAYPETTRPRCSTRAASRRSGTSASSASASSA